MVGLDVTHQCRMAAEAIEGMEGRGRHGSFLRGITQFYLDYHRWELCGYSCMLLSCACCRFSAYPE